MRTLKTIFNSIVEFFLHPSLTQESSIYEKAKMLVIVLLAVFSMLSLYTIYFLFNGVLLNPKALENYIALIAAYISLMAIKKTGNITFPLYILTCLSYLFITASAYMSGGIYSNDVSWYFVIPVAALMLIGVRFGIVASIVSLLFTTLFYVLEVMHHKDFISDSLSYGLEYKFANAFFILTLLMLIIYILVSSNRKLQTILQLNREQEIRESIARDFHDQIGNKLASIQHLTSLVAMNKSDEEKEIILKKIGNNAMEVYNNFKDFIWTKDPESNQLKEVFMYLHDFADDYLKYSNINLFINNIPEELPDITLPPEWNREIVPLFKEALTNAGKHSKASSIYFTFSFVDNTLQIIVKDDGIGINSLNATHGNGLKNLMHRANQLKGTLLVISEDGQGTEIIFTASLPRKGSYLSKQIN